MTQATIRILVAVVDKRVLTLYKEDGSTIEIPQGDPRLRHVLQQAIPQLEAKKYADVVLDMPEDNTNHFQEFEQKSSGVVKFFRIAKDKLKAIFSKHEEPVPDQAIGQVPIPVVLGTEAVAASSGLNEDQEKISGIPASLVSDAAEAVEQFGEDELERYRDEQEAKKAAPVSSTMSVVDEIISIAVPASTPGFTRTVQQPGKIVEDNGYTDNQREEVSKAPDTIVAVVGNKVVAGVEQIQSQFKHAAKLGSTKGLEMFMQRMAAIADQRRHSMDDLLKFLQRGDLPITDDGSILIYKVLRRSGNRGDYVDCHTNKVTQFVGAYVCMDVSLVDHNRRNECSNGLHVARRGYVRSFSGDVCVLAKLAPEDVIAVPEYDANKMRVCGYHILAELTDKQYSLLKSNQPITDDPDGQRLLADAIAGKHIRRTHEVRITSHMGGGVKTTCLDAEEAVIPVATPDAPKAVMALTNPEDKTKDVPVDVKEVLQQVNQVSKKQQAKDLYDAWAACTNLDDKAAAYTLLLAFKKAAKKGWDALGIPDPTLAGVEEVVPTAPRGKVDKVDRKKEPNRKSIFGEKKKATKKIDFTKQEVESATVPSSTETKEKTMETSTEAKPFGKVIQADKVVATFSTVADVLTAKITPAAKIQALQAMGIDRPGVANAIVYVKKTSKKAWGYFGLMDDDVAKILALNDKK